MTENTDDSTTPGDAPQGTVRSGRGKWIAAGIVVAVVVAGGAAWYFTSGDGKDAVAAEKTVGADGFGNLKPGMTRAQALATGDLGAAPVSLLDGCADFSFAGGPAPDPARLAAEDAVQKKVAQLNKVADDLHDKATKPLSPDAGAKEYADAAAVDADAAQASADAADAAVGLAEKREERDKAFGVSGGASFGKDGLKEIGVPAGVKTAAGIAVGSTLQQVSAAYGVPADATGTGALQFAVPGRAGWSYEFGTDGKTVTSVALMNTAMKCS